MLCLLDSIAYIKMHAALTKRSLVAGIKKASPLEQTSCLKGFHSVLNQFSPKMLSYSYLGCLQGRVNDYENCYVYFN